MIFRGIFWNCFRAFSPLKMGLEKKSENKSRKGLTPMVDLICSSLPKREKDGAV
jgi:hypothetical protein